MLFRFLPCGNHRIYLQIEVRRVQCRQCGCVKRERLERSGQPRPKVIGIDEISVRKGHEYRIVVSDLENHRPIWFGGTDRSEAPDKVRKAEYARLDGQSRTFLKGQKYALLSHPQNLRGPARKNLQLLLAANLRTPRRHDRASMGRTRRVLPTREHGLARFPDEPNKKASTRLAFLLR